ncbi:hypothetical protein KI387_015825, partial [Taxus chinensis]
MVSLIPRLGQMATVQAMVPLHPPSDTMRREVSHPAVSPSVVAPSPGESTHTPRVSVSLSRRCTGSSAIVPGLLLG